MSYPVYLINKNDFVNYVDLANNYPVGRLNYFILEAQDLDLKMFFGLAMFTDFFANLSNNPDGTINTDLLSSPYLNLLNGGIDYKDIGGYTFYYTGLKKMLIYFTLARLTEFGNSHITATGIVKKKTDESTPLTNKELSLMVNNYRSKGKASEQEVKKFLINNQSLFPLYRVNWEADRERGSGPRITGIDKTDFNLNPGLGNGLPPNWFIDRY